MATYSLQLLEQSNEVIKKVHIALKTYSIISINKNNRKIEHTVISPECCTLKEINDEIDNLMSELETIRKSAEKFFKRS